MILFLGFQLTDTIKDELNQLNEKFASIFINNEDDRYLQKISHKKTYYLGKHLGPKIDIDHIEHVKKNIYTITSRLIKGVDENNLQLQLIVVEY